ncbi:extensin family protein [Yoonia sp. 208BN28-4]|uniref:extensin family protein n=1 Tax=Yoonia sp. 208BN28-4 TaxID=3126505 RepID=UPI0030A01F89
MRLAVTLAFLIPTLAWANVPTADMRPELRPGSVPEYAATRPLARPAVEENESATTVETDDAADIVTDGVVAPLMSVAADLATPPVVSDTISTSTAPEELVSALRPDPVTAPLSILAPNGAQYAAFRPEVRPDALAPLPPAQPTAAMRPSVRPYVRPELERGAQTRSELRAEQNLFAFSPYALRQSPRPELRPAAFVRRAEEQRQAIVRGTLCGDAAIQGDAIGNVPGPGACGIENAVRVRSIAGVTLTSRAVMDCRTARALKTWVVNGARPAVGDFGGGLSSIRVIGTYSCRNRNGAAGGRLSEHANGRAIDIAGFGLRNGQELTLLTDWNRQGRSNILRQMWRAACGPFGTVLGPNSNRFHRDHFHFDTARYRSGSYCR